MNTAYRLFTSLRGGPFVREFWRVTLNGVTTVVIIEYAETWFAAVGSINDLKELAFRAAREDA